MRLSIAAGILAQTLPAVSETKISALLNSEHGRKLQLEDIVRRASRATESGGAQKQRRVKSRAGTRTGRVNEKTAESSRSGVLKNAPVVPTSSGDLVVCDPSSSDADVGVLSCGTGRVCKRSQDSVLGGICVTKKELSVNNGLDPRAQAAAQAAKNKKRAKSTEKSSSEKLKNTSRRSSRSTRTGSKTECDPLSTDADVGVLSCGTGHYCKPQKSSQLGGECTDNRRPGGATNPRGGFGNRGASKKFLENRVQSEGVECDPSSADVGILSCGPGESCVDDQGSKAGGFCVNPNPTARRLAHSDEGIGLCDPTSDVFGYLSCDCSAFDNTTKTGTITCITTDEECFGGNFYGCYATCGSTSVTYGVESDTVTSTKYCYDFSTPTTESLCVEYSTGFGACETQYNGQICSSCQVTSYYEISFDCSNVGGPSSTGGRVAEASNSISACFQPVDGEYCSLCQYDEFIPYAVNDVPVFLQGFGDTTCDGLFRASINNQISIDKCSEASAVAQSTCCATSCDLCGYDARIPERNYGNIVTVPELGETTCGALAYASYKNFSLGTGSCPEASAAAADACCDSFCKLCTTTYVPFNSYDIPISVPGFEDITTCGDLDSAAYVNLTIPEESCPALAEIAENSCCSYRCDLCGISGVVTQDYYGINLTIPGFGDVTCGDIDYAAYQNSSLDSETCPVVARYAAEVCCSTFPGADSCEVCGPNGIIAYANDNVTTTIPGVGNATCYDIFLAAYYGVPELNATCSVLSDVAQESCCRDIYASCQVCGADGFIPYTKDDVSVTVPGIGDFTCYDIYFGAYLNGTIDNETCPDFSTVAQESCCYYSGDLYYEPCYVCGIGQNVTAGAGTVTTPEGEVIGCDLIEFYSLLGYLNETECASITELSAETCCPTPADTPMPSEPGGGDTPAGSPTPGSSGTSKLRNGKAVASLAALTAATFIWLAK